MQQEGDPEVQEGLLFHVYCILRAPASYQSAKPEDVLPLLGPLLQKCWRNIDEFENSPETQRVLKEVSEQVREMGSRIEIWKQVLKS